MTAKVSAGNGWKPHAATLALVEAAREVIEDEGAYRPTLRRVYYGLVSKNLIPNTERDYKRLSAILDRARWEGLIDPDAMEDRGRVATESPHWDGPGELLRTAAAGFRSDWWAGARYRVEVWTEKDAATGVLEPLAHQYGIAYLTCRGFSSFTAVHEAAERFEGRGGTVLYAGDHDPSGLAMDGDLQSRLDRMYANVELVRVALTPAQIDAHDLPPQPTKRTDSRARGYAHDGSWELDALPGAVLEGIVRAAIEGLLPPGFEAAREADRAVKRRLSSFADSFGE